MTKPPKRTARAAREAPPEYTRALERLFERRRFGMRPGLEVISGLLGELGHPERSFRAIHVAGSKGKGSVSALLASVLDRAAPPAGLYTSPHLQSYRDRIRVGGEPIPPGEVVAGLAEVEAAEARLRRRAPQGDPPTFFEATTALGFLRFARAGVRHAAVEVGLGGEFDATNVLDAPVGVITTIELEHTDILGPTIAHIARAKGGILHRGMRAVTAETKPEALAEIDRCADRVGVPVWRVDREVRIEDRRLDEGGQSLTVVTPHRRHEDLRVPLHGTFQARNVALAVAAIDLYGEATGLPVRERALREGLAAVVWRGRLERLATGPELYVDVAHTAESARALATSLAEIVPFAEAEENVLLFGCLRGKDVPGMLEPLSALARTIVVVPLRADRSADPADLRREAFGHFPRIVAAPDAASGLTLARAATGPEGFTLAAGSDYLVGELLDALEGRVPGEPDLSDPVHPAPVPPAGRGRSR
jgi:dihydrofolate synthase/folylpolyglutamate synthase